MRIASYDNRQKPMDIQLWNKDVVFMLLHFDPFHDSLYEKYHLRVDTPSGALPYCEYATFCVFKTNFVENIAESQSCYQLDICLTLENENLVQQIDDVNRPPNRQEVFNHVFLLTEYTWINYRNTSTILPEKQTYTRNYPLACTDFFENWCSQNDLSRDFVEYIRSNLFHIWAMTTPDPDDGDILVLRKPDPN
jgi:hypothetical protein